MSVPKERAHEDTDQLEVEAPSVPVQGPASLDAQFRVSDPKKLPVYGLGYTVY